VQRTEPTADAFVLIIGNELPRNEEATVAVKICALCGQPILKKPKNDPDSGTVEHVPPSQFFPKSIRPDLRQPLWTVPSHRRCNEALKSDEEYFLSYYYGLVGFENPDVGAIILDDLRRQTKNPQARNLIKRILRNCRNVSPGGILLPPSLVRFEPEVERIDRVVFKIAQCLFYKDQGRFLPKENCGYIRFFEDPIKIPEFFRELIKTKHESVDPRFFFYWHIDIEGCHYYAMAFWGAFVFGMVFRDPDVPDDEVKMIDLAT
jgi:hypothetical protein